jgi:hypothetical protein
MNYQEYINDTEMAMDFMDINNINSLDELTELINKYKHIVSDYKLEKFPSHETIKVFGDNPFIYLDDTKIINVKLINSYRKQLLNNYSRVVELKKEKIKELTLLTKQEKSKKYYQDNREIILNRAKEFKHSQAERLNEKKICEYCKGKYTLSNKSNHEKTIKHQQSL